MDISDYISILRIKQWPSANGFINNTIYIKNRGHHYIILTYVSSSRVYRKAYFKPHYSAFYQLEHYQPNVNF